MRSVEGLHGAAAVTRAGSVELELAGGLADAGSGAECTPQTRFQIASVSRQFAATAVMLLAESGAVEAPTEYSLCAARQQGFNASIAAMAAFPSRRR